MSHQVTVEPAGHEFEVADGESILSAGRRAGIWLPYECGWGSCGTCKIAVLEGETASLYPEAPARSPRDAKRGRVLACQTTAMSDLTVEEPRAALAPSLERATVDHEGEVIDVVELAPELKMTIIRLHMQAEFRPGQYAVLNLADGLRRCYSMAGLPGSDTVSFVTRRYPGGAGSQRLHSLTTGSRITLELPYGDMWLRPTSDPVVLIAGGTGISPVLSLANELAGTPEDRPVRAFYGAARPGDLVCSEELGALLEKLPDSALHLGAATADPQWAGAVGFVTDLLRDNLDLPWEVARYYLAGPPAMADAVLALLKARGVPNDRIHYDRFG